MKAVFLAGGFGTRISEESVLKPKPMIEVGGKPILWHIMKLYSHYDIDEFVILLGYKGYLIKEYFANYYLHQGDVTINTADGTLEVHKNCREKWKITLVDTGESTMTGGRIKRAQQYIGSDPFLLTYGDGLSNIDIGELVAFHQSHEKCLTMSAVQPEGRFGIVNIEEGNENKITKFLEKPKGDNAWINAGFFVCNPQLFDFIPDGDDVVFEKQPLESLAEAGELVARKHNDFWMPMDTL
ncbi:MAG: glucose-1-phosphate cytidylyltransferase, partial [Bacteriovoracaceae bacterium]|nr:glucose-1-phosphate cytidylyltransferase [Bacteriovoracaceae bacterium]